MNRTVALVVPFPQRAHDVSPALLAAQAEIVLRLEETSLLLLRFRDVLAAALSLSEQPAGPLARYSSLQLAQAGAEKVTVDLGDDDGAETPAYPAYQLPPGNTGLAARRVSRGRAPPAFSSSSL